MSSYAVSIIILCSVRLEMYSKISFFIVFVLSVKYYNIIDKAFNSSGCKVNFHCGLGADA